MRGTPRRLGKRASFWVAAAIVAHTLWTSAAPAMTYPLYASEWGLNTTTTTAIFAIYPIVVVGVLICLGDISDHIGRRATMLLGLAASLFGVLLFAIAPNIFWIFIGRSFMGLGVGLSAGPSTAAMIEFSAAGQAKRASSLITVAQAVGLAAATLSAGALIEYAPFPTRLNFWVLFIVLAAVFVAAWFLPRHTSGETSGRWHFKAPSIPKGLRQVFAMSSTAILTAYVVGALVLSLGAQIAHDLVGSANTLVNGAAISLFAVVWGVAGLLAKRLPSRLAMTLGGFASATGMALLALSAAQHSLAIFLASIAVAGIGYSLLFLGGLSLINTYAPAHHRGGTFSALYLVAYLMQGFVALLLGAAATTWGLEVAIDLGSTAIAMFSAIVIVLPLLITPPARIPA